MQITPLFEKNLQKLRNQQPLLAKVIENGKKDYEALPELEIVKEKNGRWVKGLAKLPFFEPNPLAKHKKSYQKKSLFFIVGAGAPPFLFYQFRSLPKGTLAVVLFEPDLNVLIHTLCSTSVYLALPVGCRLSIAHLPEREYMQEVLNVNIRPMGAYVVADGEFIIHDGEAEAFPSEFKQLRDFFAQEVRIHIDILGNSAEDTLLGFRQIALNALWILWSPNLREIGASFKGLPFICVASGPSLEKNIHLLKGNENRCIIISADTALRRLLEEGILPHVVVTLERPTHTYTNYFKVLVENYGEQCRKILLVGQGVSPPQVFGRWPGPKIVVGKVEIPVDRWFIGGILRGNILRSGMSVAHMALMLASVWEAEKIALIGQDLAFGEDGASHAGKTAAASALKIERKRGLENSLEIPGALGGTVKTTNIWFLFLKVFESLIPESGRPVYDCTEGGALIKGADIQSLQTFLNTIPTQTALTSTPADETLKAGTRNLELKETLTRIDQSLEQLTKCKTILDEMEKDVHRAAGPAISTERRRSIAYELSEAMDNLNTLNPVLAFIGQSYANLSGADIAKSRWLETVEEIEIWRKVHLEIIRAHRMNIQYLAQWSLYVRTLVQMLFNGKTWLDESIENLKKELPAEDAADIFSSALEKMSLLKEIDRSGEEIASMNLLAARSDGSLSPWTPEQQWQLALFLHSQGRAEEASHLMSSAAMKFEDKEMPREEILSFFKDYARILTTPDLCFIPQYRFAKLILDNARRYGEDDEELKEMTDRVLKDQQGYLDDLYNSGMMGTPASLQARRIAAERALNSGELPETLRIVWSIVHDYSDAEPDSVRPLASWLVSTLTKCFHAEDRILSDTVQEVLFLMAENPRIWAPLHLKLPEEFMDLLQQSGLQFSLQTADTE